MRVIVWSLVAIACLLQASAEAAGELDAQSHRQLAKLESKYFGHSFDADSDRHRAERLESLMFGNPVQGDLKQRVRSMVEAAASASPAPAAGPGGGGTAGSGNDVSTAGDGMMSDTDDDTTFDTRAARTAPSSPAVAAFDKYMDGESISPPPAPAAAAAPIPVPVPVPNLAPAAAPPETVATLPAAGTEIGDYPRVTALEQAILGQAFAGQPLGERLSRMERKAFGKASTSSDYGTRTDALEAYAERKLHKKLDEGDDTGSGSTSQKPNTEMQQVAAMVGRTLLGMAGLGSGGIGGSNFGQPGFGPNLGPGFRSGGRNGRQGQEQPKPQDTQSEKEDPAVLSPHPPPPGAKLLTKVGWCEMRVFGQTFRTVHLSERLRQLNQELHFCPGKSGIELMDHVAALMKTAEARRPVARLSSSSSSADD